MAHSPLRARTGMPGRPVLGFLAGMSVVRRDAYLSVGGFHRAVGVGGEEAWLAADLAAAGWDLAYLPHVVAHHRPSASRDHRGRRRRDLRNALWFAWSRRCPSTALRRSLVLTRGGGPSPDTVAALAAAAGGLGWVRRHRRPVPPSVDADLALLDRAG